jgi:hypothetical protein
MVMDGQHQRTQVQPKLAMLICYPNSPHLCISIEHVCLLLMKHMYNHLTIQSWQGFELDNLDDEWMIDNGK